MFLHHRNKLLGAMAIVSGIALAPATALADCTLFQHRDFGGSAYSLGHFERMKMVRGESIGCTDFGHGPGCESILYEPSWNDQLSSFRVTGGCTITLWEHVNQGGARFRSSRSYSYVGSGWNDEASEALCMC